MGLCRWPEAENTLTLHSRHIRESIVQHGRAPASFHVILTMRLCTGSWVLLSRNKLWPSAEERWVGSASSHVLFERHHLCHTSNRVSRRGRPARVRAESGKLSTVVRMPGETSSANFTFRGHLQFKVWHSCQLHVCYMPGIVWRW